MRLWSGQSYIMNTKIYIIILAAILGMTACSTETISPNPKDDNELATEGSFEETTWVIANSDLPTESLRNKYESMEFVVDNDLNYQWTWKGKISSETLVFKGKTYYEKSSHTHSSGSAIYNVAVNVLTINDIELPGGWYGIYTYEDENHMSLNVEPDVTNWGDHPTAAGGLGSGQEGDKSVYRFSKQ